MAAMTTTKKATGTKVATKEPAAPLTPLMLAEQKYTDAVAERDSAHKDDEASQTELVAAKATLADLKEHLANGTQVSSETLGDAVHTVEVAELRAQGAAARRAAADAALTVAAEENITQQILDEPFLNGDAERSLRKDISAKLAAIEESIWQFHDRRDTVLASAVEAARDAGLPKIAGWHHTQGNGRFPEPVVNGVHPDRHTPPVQVCGPIEKTFGPGLWTATGPASGTHSAPVPNRHVAAVMMTCQQLGIELQPLLLAAYKAKGGIYVHASVSDKEIVAPLAFTR